MSEPRQTVMGAYDKIAAHEALCAERYANIHAALDGVKDELKWITRGVVALVIAVAGWALTQLWSGKPPAQAATPTAAGKR